MMGKLLYNWRAVPLGDVVKLCPKITVFKAECRNLLHVRDLTTQLGRMFVPRQVLLNFKT